MAASHGSKAGFRLGTAAVPGTLVDVSAFLNSVANTFNRDSAETTTLGKNSKTYIPGLKDATVPIEGPFDGVTDVQMWDLYNVGTIVSFEYTPQGVGVSGTPKFTGQAFITQYEVTSDIGDVNTMSGEMQITGDVVRAIQ